MKLKHRSVYRSYTKEDYKTIIRLWEEQNLQEISEKTGFSPLQVNYLAMQIRKAGYKLPRKKINRKSLVLVKEALQDLKLI